MCQPVAGEPVAVITCPESTLKETKIARFLPGIAVCCVWLYVICFNHVSPGIGQTNSSTPPDGLGFLWDEMFTDYYPMSIAMIFGSMIAGSTPLGGGVVAFPIAVLVIGLTPAQGRDFTLIIQAVGMNAAAFMLGLVKPHLLDFTLIATFTIMGIPGMLMGFTLDLPPFYVVLIFQILVLEFAFIYLYLSAVSPRRKGGGDVAPGLVSFSLSVEDMSVASSRRKEALAYVLMVLAAFIGGFVASNAGSGSDIALYIFGMLGWNVRLLGGRALLLSHSLTY